MSQCDNKNVNKRKYNIHHDKRQGQMRKRPSPFLLLRLLLLIYRVSENKRKRFKRSDLRENTERKPRMTKKKKNLCGGWGLLSWKGLICTEEQFVSLDLWLQVPPSSEVCAMPTMDFCQGGRRDEQRCCWREIFEYGMTIEKFKCKY